MDHKKNQNSPKDFHAILREKLDFFAHHVYKVTKKFPKDELYGLTSQFRRATVSVVLNYIEGYARNRKLVHKSFLEISYGSLKESEYLIDFSHKEGYINDEDYKSLSKQANELGAMLWSTISNL